MDLAPILVLCAVHSIAHFLLFWKMGVYEDDYYFIVNAINWDWHTLFEKLSQIIRVWSQGRPLHFISALLIPAIAYRLGGFHAIQLASLGLQLVNLILIYRLAYKVSTPLVAFTCGLLFSLFTADTTRPMLHASFAIQVSVAFLLIAAHLYLSRKSWIAYLVAPLCLFSYESVFLTFLGIPGFKKAPLMRRWAAHLSFCVIAIGAALLLRRFLGEGRASEAFHISKRVFLKQEVMSWILGPWTVLRNLFEVSTPLQFTSLPRWQVCLALLAGCSIAFTFFSLLNSLFNRRIAPPLSFGRLAFLGAILWAISYSHAPLANSRFPPTMVLGRLTSVHTGGLWAGALFLSASLGLLAQTLKRKIGRIFLASALGLFFSFTIAYHFHIEGDYAASWADQKGFWRELLKVVPDFADGTVIFVEDGGPPLYPVALSHSWADLVLLSRIFDYPSEWLHPPRVFLVPQGWQKSVVHLDHDQLVWEVPAADWDIHIEPLPDHHLIVLRQNAGHLERDRNSALDIQGHTIRLQSALSFIQEFPHKPFFSILLGNEHD